MKILVNTISTKKITGGAFQIAQNFLLKSLEHSDIEWLYVASQDVDDAIGYKFEELKGKRYFVFPTQPDYKGSYLEVKKKLAKLEADLVPDLIYTITAPCYFKFITPEVMRFTNPWVTHPNKYSWSVLTLKEKIWCYLYVLNQKRLMKVAHYFITQTETCAKGICRITGEPNWHVKVVKNVLPCSFKSVDNTPIREDEWINIAAVGAPMPHKNFDIIPDVLHELENIGISNVRFHLTIALDSIEAQQLDAKLNEYGYRNRLVNHGRMTQKDLGEMYRRCQFCFLPTLLEVFSASTVEAMYFHLPIVATDFPFNSEILEDSCLYYEPKNAKAAADQFANLIGDSQLQDILKAKMEKRLAIYDDYDVHFNTIKEFLINIAKGIIK